MPERVNAEVRRLLLLDPSIVVRYTDAITPDSFSLSYRSMYVHTCHREPIEAFRADAERNIGLAAP